MSEQPVSKPRLHTQTESLDQQSSDQIATHPAIPRWFSRFCAWLLRLIGWQIIGDPRQNRKMVAIGVPHTTNWDGPAMLIVGFILRVRFYWMGKDILFKGPLNRPIRALGGIPIYRNRRQNIVEQMIQRFDESDQLFVVVAPEGTRKWVPHWKTGFYHIALGADVPILLAKINYKRKTIDISTWLEPSGDLEADFAVMREYFKDAVGKNPKNAGEIKPPLSKDKYKVSETPLTSSVSSESTLQQD